MDSRGRRRLPIHDKAASGTLSGRVRCSQCRDTPDPTQWLNTGMIPTRLDLFWNVAMSAPPAALVTPAGPDPSARVARSPPLGATIDSVLTPYCMTS